MPFLGARRHGIAFRLLAYILLVSSAATLVSTGIELALDYRSGVAAIANRLGEIEQSRLASLSGDLWNVDGEGIKRQLDGMIGLPEVRFAEVRETATGVEAPLLVQAGVPAADPDRALIRSIPLIHEQAGERRRIGTLTVHATLTDLYRRLYDRAVVTLVSQGIKTFLVALFILFIVHRLVTRHLAAIAAALGRYDLRQKGVPMRLRRPPGRAADELDHMVAAFNGMNASLRRAYDELREANATLEARVEARTAALQSALAAAETAEHAAARATRAKSEFLASMSHELRTPLNAIIGFSEVMTLEMFGPLGERYRDYVGIIQDSGSHLLALINDVLDLSKVEAGQMEVEDGVVEIGALTEICLPMVEARARKNGCRLATDLAPDLPALRGDPLRLKQVLLNLLSNAVKFTAGGEGLVTIRAAMGEQGALLLSVIDNGVGIAAADIPKVMESWGQAQGDRGVQAEGSGLGLPLAKRLVELHGGRLELHSELGAGTTVTLIFPAERLIMKSVSQEGTKDYA